jgi:hypothetical protein
MDAAKHAALLVAGLAADGDGPSKGI